MTNHHLIPYCLSNISAKNCQKSMDVCISYHVQHQCRFFGRQCTFSALTVTFCRLTLSQTYLHTCFCVFPARMRDGAVRHCVKFHHFSFLLSAYLHCASPYRISSRYLKTAAQIRRLYFCFIFGWQTPIQAPFWEAFRGVGP